MYSLVQTINIIIIFYNVGHVGRDQEFFWEVASMRVHGGWNS